RVVSGNHATLAGVNDLARVKTEAAEGRIAADLAAAVFGADGAGGIFDDRHAVLFRRGIHGIEVRRQPDLVDRYDSLGMRAYGLFDLPGVDVVRQRINVHENRRGTAVAHDVGGGDKRQRRDYYLIAGSYAQRHQRQM